MIIYLLRNTINNKPYVGQSKKSIEKRWYRHILDAKRNRTKIARAINKYGSDSFCKEILFDGDVPQIELDELEQQYITKYDSIKTGYNIARGGRGGILCADFAKRVSEGKKAAATKRPDQSLRLLKRTKEEKTRTARLGGKSTKGIIRTGDKCKKGSTKHSAAKNYIITYPNGTITKITNLAEFCRQNNLSKTCMLLCASPKSKNKSHKNGWLCERVMEDN